MDVFSLRDRVVDDYQRYVRGFVSVSEPNARRFVEGYFNAETLWPEPLVQLNPAFEPGRSMDELAAAGVVHRDCATFFRRRDHVFDRLQTTRSELRKIDETGGPESHGFEDSILTEAVEGVARKDFYGLT